MKNKIILPNKNISLHLFSIFLINIKTKMNCKTESYFFIMFFMVGCIWIRDARRTDAKSTVTFGNKSRFWNH